MSYTVLMISGCVIQLVGIVASGLGVYYRRDVPRVAGACATMLGLGVLFGLAVLELG